MKNFLLLENPLLQGRRQALKLQYYVVTHTCQYMNVVCREGGKIQNRMHTAFWDHLHKNPTKA